MPTDTTGITIPGHRTEPLTRGEFAYFTEKFGLEICFGFSIDGVGIWRQRHVQGSDPREMYATRSGVTFHYSPEGSSISAAPGHFVWHGFQDILKGSLKPAEQIVLINFHVLTRTTMLDYLRKLVGLHPESYVTIGDLRLLRIRLETIAAQTCVLSTPLSADEVIDQIYRTVKAEVEPPATPESRILQELARAA